MAKQLKASSQQAFSFTGVNDADAEFYYL